MVVVEGVARKLNPNTNIWTTSKPVLESWLRETKDPLNTITDTLQNTSEVIKRPFNNFRCILQSICNSV